MKTCSTCVHRVGELCSHPKLQEYYGPDDHEHDALVYSYNEGGTFWVGPNFGCVHHESKEVTQ